MATIYFDKYLKDGKRDLAYFHVNNGKGLYPNLNTTLAVNGCPGNLGKDGILTYFCPYYNIPQLVKDIREAVDGIEVRYSQQLINGLKEYYKFIKVKEASLTKYLGRFPLYDHQIVGSRWCAIRDSAIISDSMGLGKSLQSIAAMPVNAPILIVAPAAAKYVWQNQFRKWLDKDSEVLSGRTSFRFPKQREVLITNYDILPDTLFSNYPKGLTLQQRKHFYAQLIKKRKALLSRCPEGLVIVADEAHKLKNPKSQRHRRFAYLADAAKRMNGKVWALTGTPINNHQDELYAIIKCIGALEESFATRANFVYHMGGNQGGVEHNFAIDWRRPRESAKYYLNNIMLRRRAEDVLDLPEVREEDIFADMSEEIVKICNEFEEQCTKLGISLEEALTLARDPGSPSYTHVMRLKSALAIAKIPTVEDMLEDYESAEEPVIVACTHVKPLTFFGARKGWAKIDGSVSSEKRNIIEGEFQEGKYKGLALSIIAGGEALTLTRAAHMVIMDLPWVPGQITQCKKRIHRIGQNRPVLFKSVRIGHPLEERIMQILLRKEALIESIVEETADCGVSMTI